MNLPELYSYGDQAISIVVNVINYAKFKLGNRQNLGQLANSIYGFANKGKISLDILKCPLALKCEKLLIDTIERKWYLKDTFYYSVRYMGSSQDEDSQYYYFETLFCQPTLAYPVPQATASVFFTVADKHTEPPEMRVPQLTFRLEGQHTDHDIRFVSLKPDWILAILQMKVKLYKRIEEEGHF